MVGPADICNLALSHLGQSVEIADFENEKSAEARACRRFYEKALKTTLRDFAWPFAGAFATLQLVEEDPTTEWRYSYSIPNDCLQFRRILSGSRNDTRQSKVEYRRVGDEIYTNAQSAVGEYTVYVSDTSKFDEDFREALSFRIAFLIAPRITGGDPMKLGERALKLYMLAISTARANARNEEQPAEPPEAESIRGRD